MIEIVGLTKYFGKKAVLQNISCEFKPGTIYGVIGYNGAGKTSLLKLAAGIYRPDQGALTWKGRETYDNPMFQSRCYLMGEDQYFQPQADIHRMYRFMKGYYPGWNQKTADTLLQIFGLPEHVQLEEFSKGMRRQAEILLALATTPECLFLDESFDGLDWGKRDLMVTVLKKYARVKQAVVVVTSHYLRELQDIADQFLLIRDHSLYQLTPEEAEAFFNEDREEGSEAIETLFS